MNFADSWIQKHIGWMNNDRQKAQEWLNKYNSEVNKARADERQADTYYNQASAYEEGLDIYGALFSSHLNVYNGFKKRYDYYNTQYENYIGNYECRNTASINHAYRTSDPVTYKVPVPGWSRIELDLDDDGKNEKWDIHEDSQRLKRAEEIPLL